MKLIILTSLVLAVVGCVVPDQSYEARHQQFLQMFDRTGKDIRKSYKDLPSGVMLPNGLIEIKVKLIRRDCYNYYQYDPKSFIVKSWRWEGAECVMPS